MVRFRLAFTTFIFASGWFAPASVVFPVNPALVVHGRKVSFAATGRRRPSGQSGPPPGEIDRRRAGEGVGVVVRHGRASSQPRRVGAAARPAAAGVVPLDLVNVVLEHGKGVVEPELVPVPDVFCPGLHLVERLIPGARQLDHVAPWAADETPQGTCPSRVVWVYPTASSNSGRGSQLRPNRALSVWKPNSVGLQERVDGGIHRVALGLGGWVRDGVQGAGECGSPLDREDAGGALDEDRLRVVGNTCAGACRTRS